MKYIRTKDGKIFEKEYFSYESILQAHFYHGRFVDCKEPIKEADTIEELIDEYVSVDKESKHSSLIEIEKHGNRFTRDKITSWIETLEEKLKRFDIYGSIWVDGELHKAARMNNEGRLELL